LHPRAGLALPDPPAGGPPRPDLGGGPRGVRGQGQRIRGRGRWGRWRRPGRARARAPGWRPR
jgi:hypothetical protein